MIKKPKQENKYEIAFLKMLTPYVKDVDLRQEYKFHPVRKWRFDFAILSRKIAFEIEGGIWNGGRHVNPIGFTKDCEKYNEAMKLGWRVFRLVPSMITEDYLESIITGIE